MEDRDRTVTALKRRLRSALDLMTERDLIQLHNLLLSLGRQETELQLRRRHKLVAPFLCRTDARTRRAFLRGLPREDALLAAYAAAAWAHRTLRLFQALERQRGGPVDLENWAALSAMELMQTHEADEGWIWPYPTRSPFQPF
ncbi:hypothetical protein [Caulobacter segnis]|uniref:hypothetical protein n=1 Tax=Caulobacter segnis TaxID=88688 RepID=UPI0026F1EF07|nr:hypothetical protein [Caulobacter segnis]